MLYLPIMDTDGPAPKVLLADKGYDADFIREDMDNAQAFRVRSRWRPVGG